MGETFTGLNPFIYYRFPTGFERVLTEESEGVGSPTIINRSLPKWSADGFTQTSLASDAIPKMP